MANSNACLPTLYTRGHSKSRAARAAPNDPRPEVRRDTGARTPLCSGRIQGRRPKNPRTRTIPRLPGHKAGPRALCKTKPLPGTRPHSSRGSDSSEWPSLRRGTSVAGRIRLTRQPTKPANFLRRRYVARGPGGSSATSSLARRCTRGPHGGERSRRRDLSGPAPSPGGPGAPRTFRRIVRPAANGPGGAPARGSRGGGARRACYANPRYQIATRL